jgi:hypothetical protein
MADGDGGDGEGRGSGRKNVRTRVHWCGSTVVGLDHWKKACCGVKGYNTGAQRQAGQSRRSLDLFCLFAWTSMLHQTLPRIKRLRRHSDSFLDVQTQGELLYESESLMDHETFRKENALLWQENGILRDTNSKLHSLFIVILVLVMIVSWLKQ